MILKSIIKAYIIITLIHFLVAKTKNKLLKYILIISVANTIITDIFKYLLKLDTSISLNLYVILNFFFWLQIVIPYLDKQYKPIINSLFWLGTLLSFSMVNIHKFYHNYFIINSIVYIIIFFWICLKNLKFENIAFFQSTNFTLVFAPVLFFLGLSFIFAFKSPTFSETFLFEGVTIYTFINSTANLVYYSLINYYIRKSKAHG